VSAGDRRQRREASSGRRVQAHEDTVRDVIHAFTRKAWPRWTLSGRAGGRPRLITSDDEEFIVTAATTRPAKLGRPFTHWSIRKLADYLADNQVRTVRAGRERLRQILRSRGISFQRTRTWKESKDPDKDAKLDRIEEVTRLFPDRCFAFDQFGPLSIRPCHGTCWAREKHPDRLPAMGVVRRRKGGDHTLAALKSIRAARPDGAPIYVIMDNLSANKTPAIRTWAAKHKVKLCSTQSSMINTVDVRGQRARRRRCHRRGRGRPSPVPRGPPSRRSGRRRRAGRS